VHFGAHGAVRLPPVSSAPVLDNERVCLRAPHAPTGVDLTPYRQELARGEDAGALLVEDPPPPYSQVEMSPTSPSDESADEDKDNEDPPLEDEEAGADMDSQSETSSVSSVSTPKTKKPRPPPTVEQLALADALAHMFIDVSQMDTVAVLEQLTKLVVQKECGTCGKKLVGKYLELGSCAKCTPKKPKEEYLCKVCGKKLIKHFRDIGLCTECNKLKIRKEEKAAKEAEKKK
jgi:hypothetical protein